MSLARTLTLDITASRSIRNKFPLLKPPNLWYSVIAAWADKCRSDVESEGWRREKISSVVLEFMTPLLRTLLGRGSNNSFLLKTFRIHNAIWSLKDSVNVSCFREVWLCPRSVSTESSSVPVSFPVHQAAFCSTIGYRLGMVLPESKWEWRLRGLFRISGNVACVPSNASLSKGVTFSNMARLQARRIKANLAVHTVHRCRALPRCWSLLQSFTCINSLNPHNNNPKTWLLFSGFWSFVFLN